MSRLRKPPRHLSSRTPSATTVQSSGRSRGWLAGIGLFAAVFCWAYLPTFLNLVDAWSSIDDYSHGFLVIPVAALFVWLRYGAKPDVSREMHAGGLVIVLAAAALRWMGANYFVEAFDGWSMILCFSGFVWLCGGKQLFLWALPSLGMLFFMVPIPYRLETALSVPLQGISAKGCAWLLQSLGQPALQEGTTIVLGDIHLEVNRACAGLRMSIGVMALAYVFVVLSRRAWWEKALILFGAIPIAVVANTVRITGTALLYQITESDTIRQSIHDNAGFVTILIAAVLFGIMTEYFKRLVVEAQVVSNRELIQGGS